MAEVPYSVIVSKDGDKVLCQPHSLETCSKCSVDWCPLNNLAVSLKPANGIPPPPNAVNPNINGHVNRLREDGNKFFKADNFPEAVKLYSMAVDMSWSRPLWDPMAFQIVREELTPVLSNRAAAYTSMNKFVDALVDAEMVTKLKKEWSKGWFRKGKALMGLKRYSDARAAYEAGLEFEPESTELNKAIEEVEKAFLADD
ncbi:hypothetical protein BC937DRAFT_95156 [Endogone sp. FLAS-F59071]|nr:hypothetical protein BC937DRAFT_95156 [Endogone sp. FLAS-F59071]|eukprot:RUS13537.1 hypothetical protein BC937DRAFT_95156 [Endogone sp. FLAS-F59071]